MSQEKMFDATNKKRFLYDVNSLSVVKSQVKCHRSTISYSDKVYPPQYLFIFQLY